MNKPIPTSTNSTLNSPLNSRNQAAQIVMAVMDGKRLEVALDALNPLEGTQRKFAAAMALTSLRHYHLINKHLRRLMKRPLPRKAKRAHAFLIIGVAQLLYMDVPAHASVSETVSAFIGGLGKNARAGAQPHKNLINAILRALSREQIADKVPTFAPLEALPDWWAQNWRNTYGEAQAEAIVKQCLTPPPLDIQFKSAAACLRMQAALTKGDYEVLHNDALRLAHSGDIKTLPDFDKGDWWIQDIAASLPARILLNTHKTGAVLDLCAAPGGKAMQLISGVAASGAEVVCVDYDAARLALLRDNLTRTSLSATLIEADILKWETLEKWSDKKWHSILLDAPCSATGTLRRNPDILLHKRQGDITRAATTQKRLLAQAATLTADGGTLLYCVCSLEPQEGEAQIQQFLNSHPDFALDPIGGLPEGFANSGADSVAQSSGMIRIMPSDYKGGCDGFFIAQLHKKA